MSRILDCHVGCEHIGKPTHFAAAHGIGLARHRERPHPFTPDASREQVAVDDGIDLVGSGTRLIDALRPDGDRAFGVGKETVKAFKFRLRNTCYFCDLTFPSSGQGLRQSRCMPGNKSSIDCTMGMQMDKEPVEQGHITARFGGKMHIGKLGGGRPARIDHDNLCAAGFFRGH